VDLPVQPPLAPMLAKPVPEVPDPAGWPDGLAFEPKWDGFRCIVFRDGDEVVLGSRNERPLTRYFPELVEGLLRELPPRCVLDGEIVVPVNDTLSFPALQERIHPAASRVAMLAARSPAQYIAFDLLALGDDSLLDAPFAQRRARLEEACADARDPVHLTPLTTDPAVARRWFAELEGAGLDGVVAKPRDLPYRPDQRVMIKIKHARTADVVVAGYRLHKSSTADRPLLGSLLLGLYDDSGGLQHVGVAGSFSTSVRAQLHTLLQPLRTDVSEHPWAGWSDPDTGGPRKPGQVSRWSTGKDLSFVPLRPDLVCEVGYDAMEGHRFRHTAQFKRWRPDRTPQSCTYAQLERPLDMTLDDVLAPGGPRLRHTAAPTTERT
jgi:ATP-dependent DNA ligase